MKIITQTFIYMFLIFSELYSQSTNKYAESGDYYYNIGNSFKKAQNFNDAIVNYNKALELYPDSLYDNISSTYWGIAASYYGIKDYSKAISACYNWINKGGLYLGNAYFVLGIIYDASGDFSTAIDAYSNAIEKQWSVYSDNDSYNIINVYALLKLSYKSKNNKYGWIPESEYWKVKIPSATYNHEAKGKNACINSFSLRIENRLPIAIKAVNIDLIIKDNKGTIVYKKNHTAWVNDLNPNEIAQSEYFDLTNEVCLPANYVDSEKFNWTSVITGVAY